MLFTVGIIHIWLNYCKIEFKFQNEYFEGDRVDHENPHSISNSKRTFSAKSDHFETKYHRVT